MIKIISLRDSTGQKKSRRDILRELSFLIHHSMIKTLCSSLINYEYFEDTLLNYTDYVLISYDSRNNNRVKTMKSVKHKTTSGGLRGFMLLSEDVDSLYVSIVCNAPKPGRRTRSKRDVPKGTQLLYEAEMLARKLRKTKIKLNALPHVILFYKNKLGYETHNKDDLEAFDKSLQYYGISFKQFYDVLMDKTIKKKNLPKEFLEIKEYYKALIGGSKYKKIDINGLPMFKIL